MDLRQQVMTSARQGDVHKWSELLWMNRPTQTTSAEGRVEWHSLQANFDIRVLHDYESGRKHLTTALSIGGSTAGAQAAILCDLVFVGRMRCDVISTREYAAAYLQLDGKDETVHQWRARILSDWAHVETDAGNLQMGCELFGDALAYLDSPICADNQRKEFGAYVRARLGWEQRSFDPAAGCTNTICAFPNLTPGMKSIAASWVTMLAPSTQIAEKWLRMAGEHLGEPRNPTEALAWYFLAASQLYSRLGKGRKAARLASKAMDYAKKGRCWDAAHEITEFQRRLVKVAS